MSARAAGRAIRWKLADIASVMSLRRMAAMRSNRELRIWVARLRRDRKRKQDSLVKDLCCTRRAIDLLREAARRHLEQRKPEAGEP